jgi:hypothetical protein
MWKALLVAAFLAAAPTAALAQTDDLSVRGSVTGVLARGQQITVRVKATHPEGFQSLSEVTIDLELHGVVLEQMEYDAGQQTLRIGGGSVLAGTGNVAAGEFFSVKGLGLRTTTAGNELTLSFRPSLVEEVPEGARFRFTATDDGGDEATSALKAAVEEEEGGLSLTTVILAIIGALVAGGFIGGQFTASRRPRSSVYSTVARKIDRDRVGAAGKDRS